MKRTISIVFALLVLVSTTTFNIMAQDSESECFGYHYSAGTVSVYGRDLTAEGELIIPSTVDDCTVEEIESEGFSNHEKINSVVISDTVRIIGNSAFSGCVALKEVRMSKGVTQIRKDAFLNTALYNDLNNWDENGALYIQDALIKVNPLCKGQFSVKEGTRIIADNAFEGCANITEVSIPDSVEFIGSNVFDGCGVLDDTANWIDHCFYLGDWLITSEDAMVSVKIKKGTRHLADSAFENIQTLRSVELPEGVEKIGAFAFYFCAELSEISLPSTVDEIGQQAFNGCNIKTLTLDPKNKDFVIENGILYKSDLKTVVFCPQQMSGEVIIFEKTEYIGDAAFWGCEKIESIILPQSLKAIGYGAFSECYKLNDVAFPNSLKYIGRYAFEYCRGLTRIVIPYSVEKLEDYAFSYCINLESVTVGLGVKEIKAWTFGNCEKLDNIELPYAVEKIDGYAFFGTGLVMNAGKYDSQGLLYIDKYLIKAKENETGVYEVPEGTTLIAENCFDNCYDVENIIIPNSVKHLNNYGLKVRNNLKKITYFGTEKEWDEITIDSCIGTFPEEQGIVMISGEFNTKLLVCMMSLSAGAFSLLVWIYRKQRPTTIE